MRVKNHRLYQNNGSVVPFQQAASHGNKLNGAKPKFIIIHYTAGSSGKGTISWFKNKDAKVSAHLVIDRDGTITQMVPFDTKAWHAGTSSWKELKGLNNFSVGIEIANWGRLKGQSGNWLSSLSVPISEDRVIMAAHRNQPDKIHPWEIFDTAQIEATLDAVRALAAYYDIEPNNLLGHDDISWPRKQDPGPAWDMEGFRAKVFGRRDDDEALDFYEVTARGGLNMRSGQGIQHDKVQTLAKGTQVSVIDTPSVWWLVAQIEDGEENTTGWVHSRWLSRV